jgi:hypothetical protein
MSVFCGICDIWPRISESEQKSFDATCRKLCRFLEQGNTP